MRAHSLQLRWKWEGTRACTFGCIAQEIRPRVGLSEMLPRVSRFSEHAGVYRRSLMRAPVQSDEAQSMDAASAFLLSILTGSHPPVCYDSLLISGNRLRAILRYMWLQSSGTPGERQFDPSCFEHDSLSYIYGRSSCLLGYKLKKKDKITISRYTVYKFIARQVLRKSIACY